MCALFTQTASLSSMHTAYDTKPIMKGLAVFLCPILNNTGATSFDQYYGLNLSDQFCSMIRYIIAIGSMVVKERRPDEVCLSSSEQEFIWILIREYGNFCCEMYYLNHIYMFTSVNLIILHIMRTL